MRCQYIIQQLIYDFVVYWHSQYGDDAWDKIAQWTYRSMESQVGLLNMGILMSSHLEQYADCYDTVRRELQGGK